MQKFGLIGNPIAHSKSPALFAAAYALAGDAPFCYDLIEAESCAEAMVRFQKEEYSGINITSPFKEEVMHYVQHPDRVSTLLGAANVIIRGEDGLYSYNTDYYGVYDTIAGVEGFLPQGKEVLVIGGGGAGKAAALALADLGMKVTMANRTPSKIETYCRTIGVGCTGLQEIPALVESAAVIVYALMMPVEQLAPQMLRSKILLEANYAHPNYLPAGESEYRYIGGRDWLINQAIPAFKLFTSLPPDVEAMRGCFPGC